MQRHEARSTPRIARLSALLASLAVLSCSAPPEPWPPPDIVLISVDTLRADHLGAYGYDRPVSPRIDELARVSAVFERAYSTASHTLPSHGSLLTGLYPSRHGALDSTSALGSGIVTLAEFLAEHGFTTAAFVNSIFLTDRYGLERGFETFDDTYAKTRTQSRSAESTNRAILRWVDRLEDGPFFLFAHYYDVHSDWKRLPYDSPDAYRKRFAGPPPAGFKAGDGEVWATRYMLQRLARKERYGEAELLYLQHLYDAGVAYTDAQIGSLLDSLRERGKLDRAIVVLTADHGEEFLEHGLLIHAQLYREVVQIPLLVSLPEMRGSAGPSCQPGEAEGASDAPRPSRVSQLVQLVDLLPTLADCLGVAPPAGVQGTSFRSLLSGGDFDRRAAYFESPHEPPWGDQSAIILDGWKLVRGNDLDGAKLFDLANDPQEQTDLSKRHPDKVDELARTLAQQRVQALQEGVRGQVVDLPAEERDALEALGYLSDDPPD